MACTSAICSIHTDAELKDALVRVGPLKLLGLRDGCLNQRRNEPFLLRFTEYVLFEKLSGRTEDETVAMLRTLFQVVETGDYLTYKPLCQLFYARFDSTTWAASHPKQWALIEQASDPLCEETEGHGRLA